MQGYSSIHKADEVYFIHGGQKLDISAHNWSFIRQVLPSLCCSAFSQFPQRVRTLYITKGDAGSHYSPGVRLPDEQRCFSWSTMHEVGMSHRTEKHTAFCSGEILILLQWNQKNEETVRQQTFWAWRGVDLWEKEHSVYLLPPVEPVLFTFCL